MTNTQPQSFFQSHEDIVLLYYSAESLYDFVQRYEERDDEFDDVLDRLNQLSERWSNILSRDGLSFLWLCRRAYVQMFPGKLLFCDQPSYHDLAMRVATSLDMHICTAHNVLEETLSGRETSFYQRPSQLISEALEFAKEQLAHDDFWGTDARKTITCGHFEMEAALAATMSLTHSPQEPVDATNVLGSKQKKALDIIKGDGPISGKVLARQVNVAESTLRRHIIPALRPFGVKNDGDGYYVTPRS